MGTAERKEREKRRRLNDILDAAEEVFFEKGLKEATMDEVAARAELSKGTIYSYFESKEMLYVGINLRAMTALREKFLKAVAQHEHGADKLMAIGRAYIEFAYQYPLYFRAMSFYESMDDAALEKLAENPAMHECHTSGTGLLELIAETVKLGQREGHLRPEIDPMKTAILLWASGNGVIQMNQNKGSHLKDMHGLAPDFILEEYMNFCARSLFIEPPEPFSFKS